MKEIKQIIKKELDKIFKFPRVIFSTLILPGLLIFGIYSFMGTSLKGEIDRTTVYKPLIIIENAPDSFLGVFDAFSENFIIFNPEGLSEEQVKEKLVKSELDLVVTFSDDFEDSVFTEDSKVTILANNGNSNSYSAYSLFSEILNAYKEIELAKLDIKTDLFVIDLDDTYTDEKKNVGMVLAMLMPMLIITFVFAGTLSIGADAIAGEKERGTLATLLMAPIRRNSIIIGKIISTAFIAIVSAASSFVGVLASMPFAKDLFNINASVSYSFVDFVILFAVLIVLGALSSSLILLASTFAKSTKEAASYAMPIYIIAILIPTFSMFSSGPISKVLYTIPIYNISLILKDIFSFNINVTNFLITIASTVVFVSILIFVLLKMFKSEKILFNK
ncbi:MAG: ABC transporter permease [Bacilli bacterium]